MQELEDVYRSIHSRATPIPQPDIIANSVTYCKAIWAIGDWTMTRACEKLMVTLRTRLGSKCVLYSPDGTAPDGNLHWTLFQTNTFPVSVSASDHPTLVEEGDCLRKLTYSHPHLEITFRGFAMSRYGLFFCGYPSWDVNRIRADIRKGYAEKGFLIQEPHPQDIAHATLLRLTGELSDDDITWLKELATRYWNTDLFHFVPRRWEFGFGTWLQRDGERIVCAEWPVAPRWILHRGLSAGPDSELENVEAHLWKQLTDGWDIECDVWCDEQGRWWLGHDGPEHRICDVDRLLKHPRAWVHCKNLRALQECVAGKGRTFFFHDTDTAVLTSSGHIWAYPGNIVGGQMGVCVMPERNGFRLTDITGVSAVCSDYMPVHFDSDA